MCKRILANQTNKEGGIPFFKIGTIGKKEDSYIPETLFHEYKSKYPYPDKGQILITCAGTIGRCLVFDGSDAYYQDSNIVWIDNEESSITNQYLFYVLNGTDWSKLNTSTIVRLYNDDLRALSISLPSLEEQEKIAEFLSLIDERIETQRQTIEERKKQKKALLHQIFSQSLRFPDFSDPWQQTTLGEVCTIKTGKLDANAMVENGSYPFFTCAKQTYQTDTYSFSGEAILIAGNGEVGLTKYYNGKFNAYQRTYVLQSFSSDIILLFIRNHIDYALPKRIISFLNGSAMPYITLSTLSDMPISLPSLEEQRKIAELLAIFDERIEAEEALLKCYKAQKRYLLRQMFV